MVTNTGPHPDALIGQRVGASYCITRWLGAGGMGAVYLATSAKLGDKPIAVKVLARELDRQFEAIARFRAEAYAAGMIDDANIVRVTDAGELDGGQHYILMEYCDGGSLQGLLDQRGVLPFDLVITTMSPIAAALVRAHEAKLVHRDIKPPNILFMKEGASLRAKLGDFGLVKLLDRVAFLQTAPRMLLGSAGYMPAEQTDGRGHVDSRSDIYAFGSVLYQMVTGRLPYDGTVVEMIRQAASGEAFPSPTTLRPDLPPEWNDVIVGCLAHRREDRIQTITEVIHRLARAIPNGESLMGFFAPRLLDNSVRAPTATTFSDAIGPAATLWTEANSSIRRHHGTRSRARGFVLFLAGLVAGGAGATAVMARGGHGATLEPRAAEVTPAMTPIDASTAMVTAVDAPVDTVEATRERVAVLADAGPAGGAPVGASPRTDTGAEMPASPGATKPARPVSPPLPTAPHAVASPPPKPADKATSTSRAPTRTPPDAPTGQALLHIKVKPFAEVSVDGQPIGTTPRELTVKAGVHHVVLTGSVDGVDKHEELDVNVTKETTVSRTW